MKNLNYIVMAAVISMAGNLQAQTVRTFTSPAPVPHAKFGTSLAVVADSIFIGEPGGVIGKPGGEAVYLFRADNPDTLKTYRHSTIVAGDNFGTALAVAKGSVYIGAPLYNNQGITNSGAVYRFDISKGTILDTLQKPNPSGLEQFGSSLAVSDNIIIVGAPFDSVAAKEDGAVYIFDLNTGRHLRTIPNPFPNNLDHFGSAIAVVGNRLVIGTPDDDTVNANAGAVYVYGLATGERGPTFLGSDYAVTRFGFSVAGFGDSLLVGAPGSSAAAFLIDINTGQPIHSFTNPEPSVMGFGYSVAAAGNNVLIAARARTAKESPEPGLVHVFNGTTGEFITTYRKPQGTGFDGFGAALATVGENVLVGAPEDSIVAAEDGAAYLFIVGMVNQKPPRLNPIADQTTSEGAALEVLVTATDPDGGKITLAARNLPSFGILTDNGDGTGRIRFTPDFFAAGVYRNIQVIATDDGTPALSDSISFSLTVKNVNRPPVLTPTANQTVNEGVILEFLVTATDPDGDTLRLRVINLPAFGSFSDNGDGTGRIRFTPGFDDAGVYSNIRVIANDNGAPSLSDTTSITLTVRDVNRAPVLAAIANQAMNEAVTLNISVLATDPDGDSVVLSVTNLPTFGSFINSGNSTGIITFAPGIGDAGVYPNIEVIATDNRTPTLSDTTSFTLTVTAAAARHDIVINEILYDPNYDDLGTERIELRNVGANTVSLHGWALWVQRDTLSTFWKFPNTAAVDTGALLVVHWLASGNNNAGNLFTGRPFDSGSPDDRTDQFWGNNSAFTADMTLSGTGSSNNVPFTLAVVQLESIIIPDIAVDPTRLDFGGVLVGRGLDNIVVVSNNGIANLEVSATQVIGADSSEFEVTAGKAPFTLAPRESRNVTVRFNPTSRGIRSATLRIRSNDPDEDPFDVPLEGEGQGIDIVPDTSRVIDFVQRGRSVPFRDRIAGQKRLRSQQQLNDFTMIDFIQIGGSVVASESLAVKAGLWRQGDFLEFAPEGHSYELKDNPADTVLTTPSDFLPQPSPSIGFKNILALPPEKHLLISEICVRPGHSEFIEIFNPDSINSVPLANYYLTDVGNAYTRLVKDPDSLQINGDDFFVRFPDNATIRPLQYQTVAISANDFVRRYRTRPTYEIVGDDTSASNNMRPVKPGAATKPDLADAGETVILLKWDGDSDLLQDVDFVAWGRTSTVESINKTGLGIDGRDADGANSYYDNDTDLALQHSIANQAHDILKSWQRRPRPREFGELLAGGNGISGHDETSERLEEAFRELPPTPIGPPPDDGSPDDELDLEFVTAIVNDSGNGNGDGIVNPGEAISMVVELKNNAPDTTGPLFSVLRLFSPFDQFVTLGADSTANYPPIAPDDTARSLDIYEFSVKPIFFPDTLRVIRFILFVVDKQTGKTLQSQPRQMIINSNKKVNKGTTLNTQSAPSGQTLIVSVQAASPNLNIFTKFFTVVSETLLVFIKLNNTGTAPAENMCVRLDMTNIGSSAERIITDVDTTHCTTANPCMTGTPCGLIGEPCSTEEKFRIQITPSGQTFLNTATTLSGNLVIQSNLFNATLPVSLSSFPTPSRFIEVVIKFPTSTVLVPDVRIKLIEQPASATLADIPTDKYGRVRIPLTNPPFDLSASNKFYRIQVVTPVTAVPTDLQKINISDFIICAQKAASPTDDDRLLGDVSQDGSFLSTNDCPAIQAFALANPMSIAAIPPAALFAGQWRVKNTDPLNTLQPNEADLGSGLSLATSNNKFVAFNAMLLGDLNASWRPLTPTFHSVRDLTAPTPCTITPARSSSGSELTLDAKENPAPVLPENLELLQNYPNPLWTNNQSHLGTTIRFALPEPALVSVKIYNILGKLVKDVIEKQMPAGVHSVIWRGDGDNGETVGSGIYFVRLQSGNAAKVERIVLIR